MSARRPRLLLVGGSGGLVGRAVLPAFQPEFEIRSVHRNPVAREAGTVEWIRADVSGDLPWGEFLQDIDVVLNLAWYRWGPEETFRRLYEGLSRLVESSVHAGVRRFLHVSVPAAPESLERSIPYLRYKRELDRALAESGLSYRIVRPTLLYGEGDVLLGVMLRLIRRYPVFPLFGDGEYHVSPVAATDLARILRREADRSASGTVDIGGPDRLRYLELTDLLFRVAGKRPRYLRMSVRRGIQLTRWLVRFGSTLLYPYEVEWLASDLLGLPEYREIDPPLMRVQTYLKEAGRKGANGALR
jgi:uncharacterized protein YbjT (DUF2867 family)